jgi:hypothetical protein
MQASKNVSILSSHLNELTSGELRAIVARAAQTDRRKRFIGCPSGQVARIGEAILAVREAAR